MDKLASIIQKAQTSAFYRWVLNLILWRVIPFNHPHKFKIEQLDEENISIRMPYRKSNLNHIKGLHACGLATLSEYACGLKLVQLLGSDRYRIIMQKIEMEYFYQGKTDAILNFTIKRSFIEQEILPVLVDKDAVLHTFELNSYDTNGNHLCTGKVTWQIKEWKKVKTKV